MKTTKKSALLVVLLASLVFAACSDDESESTSSLGTDAAFVAEMIPHHESAIEMAEIAQERAEHPEIKRLADDIVETQSREIQTLRQIEKDVAGEEPASLGLSSEDMGMDMDTSALETAKPFDREFIDMMISHHQAAILMAHEELANGTLAEAQGLADAILTSQSQEIEAMNEWREQWYGAPSPSGGVPEYEGAASAGHEGMGQ